VNPCTLTDTLDVLGPDLDELEQRALAQLAEIAPIIVAVVEELLNRAARNAYDPVRYAVPGPAPRRLRAVPQPDNKPSRTDTDHR
jgi:hypothetical protein